jgi:archaellum component FlaF (FlaF/FlaG flagellin family)
MAHIKLNRGMSTILGTLIFVGIMFSAIVPMQVVMQQADNYKLQKINEMEKKDSERYGEDITLTYYPQSQTSDQICVKISNEGVLSTRIVRVWIRDTFYVVDEIVESGESKTFGPYTVTLVEGVTYPVQGVTERGNIFSADMISLVYSDGQWYTPSLGINVYISNEKGKYYILVNNATWSDFYETLGMDHGDLSKYFEVDSSGVYTVTCRKNNENGPLLPGTPVNIEIDWPSGPPILYVYTSGE